MPAGLVSRGASFLRRPAGQLGRVELGRIVCGCRHPDRRLHKGGVHQHTGQLFGHRQSRAGHVGRVFGRQPTIWGGEGQSHLDGRGGDDWDVDDRLLVSVWAVLKCVSVWSPPSQPWGALKNSPLIGSDSASLSFRAAILCADTRHGGVHVGSSDHLQCVWGMDQADGNANEGGALCRCWLWPCAWKEQCDMC